MEPMSFVKEWDLLNFVDDHLPQRFLRRDLGAEQFRVL